MVTQQQFEDAIKVIQAALRERLVTNDYSYEPKTVDQIYVNSGRACPITYTSDFDSGGWTVCDNQKLRLRTEVDVLKEELAVAEKKYEEQLRSTSESSKRLAEFKNQADSIKLKLAQLGKYP